MRRMMVLWVYVWCFLFWLPAQGLNKLYVEYIEKYKDMAVAEMVKHRVPASITLAQGLLESGAGRSTLAKYSNNHFGIKCGRVWNGSKSYHNDDRPNECFREYEDVSGSFEDHSLFLVRNARYASLFALDITDYKGWAHGLKRAGYATNPNYGNLLVKLIERYELYRYDVVPNVSAGTAAVKSVVVKPVKVKRTIWGMHSVFIANGLAYVVAREGDSWDVLSKELGISAKKLRKYNDYYADYVLKEGDIVYLKQKNRKAQKGTICHVLKSGESMHSVSQKYGIRLKSLYKMNKMSVSGDVPEVGDTLRVR